MGCIMIKNGFYGHANGYDRLMNQFDRSVWRDGSDQFSVRVCYTKILDLHLRYFTEGVFNWNCVWLDGIPSKVYFLL